MEADESYYACDKNVAPPTCCKDLLEPFSLSAAVRSTLLLRRAGAMQQRE